MVIDNSRYLKIFLNFRTALDGCFWDWLTIETYERFSSKKMKYNVRNFATIILKKYLRVIVLTTLYETLAVNTFTRWKEYSLSEFFFRNSISKCNNNEKILNLKTMKISKILHVSQLNEIRNSIQNFLVSGNSYKNLLMANNLQLKYTAYLNFLKKFKHSAKLSLSAEYHPLFLLGEQRSVSHLSKGDFRKKWMHGET